MKTNRLLPDSRPAPFKRRGIASNGALKRFDLVVQPRRSRRERQTMSSPNIASSLVNDGVGVRRWTVILTPGADTVIILRALDRIADVLKAATMPIRKVLLHTCNVGNSVNFTQLLSHRLQVPVQSHRDFIAYTGTAGSGTILAHYDSEGPVSPRDLTEWPLSKLCASGLMWLCDFFLPAPTPLLTRPSRGGD